jgi:copper(I)-binding protein
MIRLLFGAICILGAFLFNVVANSNKNTNKEKQEPLQVVSATARPSLEGSYNSAAYLTIHNNTDSDITLIDAKAPSVANNVELHTIATDNGVKKMVKVNNLVIPQQGNLVMQPGGIHIMLMNLKDKLNSGERFNMTIKSKEYGYMKVSVCVTNILNPGPNQDPCSIQQK